MIELRHFIALIRIMYIERLGKCVYVMSWSVIARKELKIICIFLLLLPIPSFQKQYERAFRVASVLMYVTY